MPAYLLDFKTFPIIHGVIHIPQGTVLYRGYDSKYGEPNTSERPAYFTSNIRLAQSYADLANKGKKTGKVGCFITTKPIRLFDLRYIRNIITDIFLQKRSRTDDVINIVYTLSLSYGLTTLQRQLEFIQKRYKGNNSSYFDEAIEYVKNDYIPAYNKYIKDYGISPIQHTNPIELNGFRFAETENDALSVEILKQIFQEKIDGYIAPEMFSPFHPEKEFYVEEEIVLFNPLQSGLKQIIEKDDRAYIEKRLTKTSIEDIVDKTNFIPIRIPSYGEPVYVVQTGGYKGKMRTIEDRNHIFDKGDKLYEAMHTFANDNVYCMYSHLFENKDRVQTPNHPVPVPTCRISPWIQDKTVKKPPSLEKLLGLKKGQPYHTLFTE